MKAVKNVVLPDEVAVAFKLLPYTSRCKGNADPVRIAYITVLRDKGWTFQSIANAAGGITCSRVQQLCKIMEINNAKMIVQNHTDTVVWPALPLPEVPEVPEKHIPLRRTQSMLTAETLDRLLQLKPLAAKARGANSRYINEAEEYVALLWYAHAIEGVSLYRLERLLSGGIRSRLVRYGYMPSNSTRRDRQPLQRREVAV